MVSPGGGLVVVGAGLQTAVQKLERLGKHAARVRRRPGMVAQARLLRATALLELGVPEGRAELAAYS